MSVSSVNNSYTLLDYVKNSDSSSSSSVGELLSSANNAKVSALTHKYFAASNDTNNTNLSAAEDMEKYLQELSETDFTKTDKATTEKIISGFITSYNSLLSTNASDGSAIAQKFFKLLAKDVNNSESALKSIGITVTEAGTLKFDNKTFESADADTIESVFNSKSDLHTSLSSVASMIKYYSSESLSASKALSTLYSNSGSVTTDTTASSLINSLA